MSPTSCHCSTPRRRQALLPWVPRPRLPGSPLPSTLGAVPFHDPVRDGSGWFQHAPETPMVRRLAQGRCPAFIVLCRDPPRIGPAHVPPSPVVGAARDPQLIPDQASPRSSVGVGSSARTPCTAPLSYRVVSPGPYQPCAVRRLVLQWASHLDAFSGSPSRP